LAGVGKDVILSNIGMTPGIGNPDGPEPTTIYMFTSNALETSTKITNDLFRAGHTFVSMRTVFPKVEFNIELMGVVGPIAVVKQLKIPASFAKNANTLFMTRALTRYGIENTYMGIPLDLQIVCHRVGMIDRYDREEYQTLFSSFRQLSSEFKDKNNIQPDKKEIEVNLADTEEVDARRTFTFDMKLKDIMSDENCVLIGFHAVRALGCNYKLPRTTVNSTEILTAYDSKQMSDMISRVFNGVPVESRRDQNFMIDDLRTVRTRYYVGNQNVLTAYHNLSYDVVPVVEITGDTTDGSDPITIRVANVFPLLYYMFKKLWETHMMASLTPRLETLYIKWLLDNKLQYFESDDYIGTHVSEQLYKKQASIGNKFYPYQPLKGMK
jgi:hypothetical protein